MTESGDLPPDIIPSEPIISVFPAPVSPVNTFKPLLKSISKPGLCSLINLVNSSLDKSGSIILFASFNL